MDIIIITLLIVNFIATFSVYYKLDKKDDDNKRKVVQKVNGNGNVQSVNTVKVDYKELRKMKQSTNIKNNKGVIR
jgi:hypothetical protein